MAERRYGTLEVAKPGGSKRWHSRGIYLLLLAALLSVGIAGTAARARQGSLAHAPGKTTVSTRSLQAVAQSTARARRPLAKNVYSSLSGTVASLPAGSLLDEVGRLRGKLPSGDIATWRSELLRLRQSPPARTTAGRLREARLRVLIGEWELAVREEPEEALQQFQTAAHLTPADSDIHGLAAYDAALALHYDGRYADATTAFSHLLKARSPSLKGFPRQNAARWFKHASACAAQHSAVSQMGVPEPTKLDTLCGAAGIAACLRANGLPYDRKTVLSVTRVTGRGSRLEDLTNACNRLGTVVPRTVTADEIGLKALPKPLIAFVEHDHFVTVIKADAHRVAYLCNDCGAWPGGRVDLTWKQWRALEAGPYLTVVRKGGAEDRALAAVLDHAKTPAPQAGGVRVAMAARQGGLGLGQAGQIAPMLSQLKGHVVAELGLGTIHCGYVPNSTQCGLANCPLYCVTSFSGPALHDPVNLATGEEEYTPTPDLAVYNPHGPAVSWRRIYNSLRGFDLTYQDDDFGSGWSHSYNYIIHDPDTTFSTTFSGAVPRGGQGTITRTGTNIPANSKLWDVVYNGTVIAASVANANGTSTVPAAGVNPADSTNGWNVTYDSGSQTFTVSAPWYVTQGSGYTVRYNSTGPGIGFCSTSAPVTTTQVAWGPRSSGRRGAGLATHADTVEVALVKLQGSAIQASAPFSVGNAVAGFSAGTKYLVLPNGARITFSAASMPTAANPTVTCYPDTGAPFLILWNYDATDTGGYYTVLRTDGLRLNLSTHGAKRVTPNGAGLVYRLTSIQDKVGNTVALTYGIPGSSGFPVLSTISDASTGTALLTLFRDIYGNITEARDCYGRSVYYQEQTFQNQGVPGSYRQAERELTQVSQIVATGTATPPARYTLGYQNVGNGEGSETIPMLHTITVPSPTGTGTSTATINYESGTGFVASIADGNGNTRVFTPCDASGTAVTSSTPTNYAKVTIKDPQGATCYSSITGFDGQMNRTSQTDGAFMRTFTFTYSNADEPYRPSQVTDGANRVWSYLYDRFGHTLTATDPRNTVSSRTYDYSTFPVGRLTQVQDGAKAPTDFTYYEPSGLVHTVTAPAPTGAGVTSVTYSRTYSALGNLLAVTGPGNNAASQITVSLGYTTDGAFTQPEALGLPITVTNGLGKTRHIRYDARGNSVSEWDALGNEYDATYNLADQQITGTLPGTGQTGSGRGSTEYSYLFSGGPMTVERLYDESGGQVRQISYTYGLEGELLARTGNCDPISNQYDAAYRRVSRADGNGNTTTYHYNAAGYVDTVSFPDAKAIHFVDYDGSGRLLESVDQRNVETDYQYNDIAGALTDVQYPATPSLNSHNGYDTYGRLTSHSDGSGSQAYAYDDRDMLVSVTTTYTSVPPKSISYSYYPDGSRAGMVTPAGAFTYGYDATGRPSSIANPFSEVTAWTYLDNGWVTQQLDANGTAADYTYDPLGRLQSLANRRSSNGSWSTLSEFDGFSYDGAGNCLSVSSAVAGVASLGGVTSYTYGLKDELLNETSSRLSGYTNVFAYDNAGNATTFRGATKSYNPDNELTGSGFAYDDAGNPTLYNGGSLTFDAQGQVVTFGPAMSAGYSSNGLRAWKQGNAQGRRYFLYDGPQPVLELDSSGNVLAANTFGIKGLISRHTVAGSVFYSFDERGNTVERLDGSGNLLSFHAQDVYGATLAGAPATLDDPFDGMRARAGYYTDHETGYVLCTLRYFDPATGRWISRDPAGYAGGANLYDYVQNNPVGNLDPLGLCGEGEPCPNPGGEGELNHYDMLAAGPVGGGPEPADGGTAEIISCPVEGGMPVTGGTGGTGGGGAPAELVPGTGDLGTGFAGLAPEGPITDPGRMLPPLMNSVGQPYPKTNDPRTGELIPYPSNAITQGPIDGPSPSWSGGDKRNYIVDWYNRGYPEPEQDWGDLRPHHILPRKFGGDNSFWNLVPLTDEQHKPFTDWWRGVR